MLRGHKPLPGGLAILFLVLLLASLAARFWAGEQSYRFIGPTHIAVGSERVWVFASGQLFRLSPEGESMGVYPSSQTGLESDPIDLRVMIDGRLLLAEQEPARIRLCDPGTWECESILAAAIPGIKRQFKIIPGKKPGVWLLTDAVGDTLWEIQQSVSEPRALLPAGTLAGPNDLVFDSSGGLWVADTDHRRLVELVTDDNEGYIPGREHSAVNELTVGQRWYPMMLAVTSDQRLWVAQAADFSKPWSDLVIYDRENGAQALVDLPKGAYATDVAVLGDQVLVTDLEQFAVYRIDSGTLAVDRFGDKAFRESMEENQQSRLQYDRLGTWALVSLAACGALMILFAVLATPKGKRWTRPPPAFDPESVSGEVPETRRVHWLERNPRIERNMKWGERLFHASLIGLVVSILVVYALLNFHAGQDPDSAAAAKADELGIILLLGGVMLALLVPVVRLSVNVVNRKLGTDGRRLYIRLEDGRELAVNPSDLLYTNRAILYRRYMFPLMGGKGQALYLPGELDTWLAPLLRESRRVSWTESLKYQWKHQQSLLIWSLLAAVAASSLLVTLLMTEF
jgi:streptogramin lyase